MADGFYTLTSAISSKAIEVLRYLLTSGNFPANRHYEEERTTALIYAAELGSVEGIQCLVENGARVNEKDAAQNTAVIRAAQTGRLDSIRTLVSHGALVNAKNKHGKTALTVACERGDESMTQWLVEAGADLNCCQKDGDTPLLKAVQFGSLAIVKYLVENGADLLTVGTNNTPLTVACRKEDIDIVKLLVSSGCDVNSMTKMHGTALIQATLQGSLEAVKILVNAGANLDSFFQDSTALMIAAENGSVGICQFLVDSGANVNIANIFGDTALISAAVNDKVKIVQLLLRAGATIDHCNGNKETAMIAAAYSGRKDVVEFLAGAGANMNTLTTQGDSILTVSVTLRATDILKWLLSVDPSRDGVTSKESPKVDINHRNMNGDTALIIASGHGDSASVECLLKAGADWAIVNSRGLTALHEAMRGWVFRQNHNNNEVSCPTIDLLIAHGGIANRDLHYAISQNKCNIVEKMVERGAMPKLVVTELMSPRSCGMPAPKIKIPLTPFSAALLKNNTAMAKYFVLKWFFHEHDLKPFLRSARFGMLLNSVVFSAQESLAFLEKVFSQPWTLTCLSFVAVSNAMGFGPSRESRVARSGLPAVFQRRLLFRESTTNVPVSSWSSITLEHLHG